MAERRLPRWMKMKMPKGENYSQIKNLSVKHNLHTICISGNCPNIGECWNRGSATFMILGDICTRSCKFCGVKTGKPLAVDSQEPQRVAESVHILGLKHCVITSVDRDDLPDGGAQQWANTIIAVKKLSPGIKIETLIPDFRGCENLIDIVINAGPNVISHNLETVARLTPDIRSVADYYTSLAVLKYIADKGVRTKSGIMLGLGETTTEVLQTMDDLLSAGCKIITIGQYLQPTREHLQVAEYVHPNVFEDLKIKGLEKGFTHVESHPLVRSSYMADKHAE